MCETCQGGHGRHRGIREMLRVNQEMCVGMQVAGCTRWRKCRGEGDEAPGERWPRRRAGNCSMPVLPPSTAICMGQFSAFWCTCSHPWLMGGRAALTPNSCEKQKLLSSTRCVEQSSDALCS